MHFYHINIITIIEGIKKMVNEKIYYNVKHEMNLTTDFRKRFIPETTKFIYF